MHRVPANQSRRKECQQPGDVQQQVLNQTETSAREAAASRAKDPATAKECIKWVPSIISLRHPTPSTGGARLLYTQRDQASIMGNARSAGFLSSRTVSDSRRVKINRARPELDTVIGRALAGRRSAFLPELFCSTNVTERVASQRCTGLFRKRALTPGSRV